MTPPFSPVAFGVDDLTLRFDMAGSQSVRRLNELPGSQTRRRKMLGEPTSWGNWAHFLGVIGRRNKQRDSPFGYTTWWLTLDGSAHSVTRKPSDLHDVGDWSSPQ